MLSVKITDDAAIALRAMVFNQKSLFAFLHEQVTGDPGGAGMRDKFVDISKEVIPEKYSWLREGVASFGIGQMSALSAAAFRAAGSLIIETQFYRDTLRRVQQSWAVHQAVDYVRHAALHASLTGIGPPVPVLMSRMVSRTAAFAIFKANPNALFGMSKQEIYNHTKQNQKILITVLTDSESARAAAGDVTHLAQSGAASKLGMGAVNSAVITAEAAALKLDEVQMLRLVQTEVSKTTAALTAVRAAVVQSEKKGVNAIFMSLEGRLALGSIMVQMIGIYNAFLTIKKNEDADKVRDAWFGMFDSVAGLMGGVAQMCTVSVEAAHIAAAGHAAGHTAAEASEVMARFRLAGNLAGMAGGAINAIAMWIQKDEAKKKGNVAASDLYLFSAVMFGGTIGTSGALGASVVARSLVNRGTAGLVARAIAGRGASILIVDSALIGVTVSGVGVLLLVLGVSAQLGAIALTPSDVQRWLSRSYFGKDRAILGWGGGRRGDSFPKGNWRAEKDGLDEAMHDSAKESEKFLAEEKAARLTVQKK